MVIQWTKIEPENIPVWNQNDENKEFLLKEGDELMGRFQEKKENVGPNKSSLYTFKKEDGELISVWGSSLLDTRFKNLVKDEMVKICYLGLVKSERTGRNYHNYEVYHGEETEQKDEQTNQ